MCVMLVSGENNILSSVLLQEKLGLRVCSIITFIEKRVIIYLKGSFWGRVGAVIEKFISRGCILREKLGEKSQNTEGGKYIGFASIFTEFFS
jgi:hypothetical protein